MCCAAAGVIFIFLSQYKNVLLDEVNVWYKPFKFAWSIAIYCFTMALFCSYLPSFNIRLFSWVTVLLLGFEIVYIALQAAKGQRSHFNTSTPLYTVLYSLMAVAASAVAVYTAYVGVLFYANSFPTLPPKYVAAIRWGILIFTVFSFQGFLMGGRLSHTVGAADGNHGIAVLNWSKKYGDLRVAHFVGMHALQLLPLLANYILKSTLAIHIAGVAYLLLAIYTLVQALQGKPFM